MKTSVKKPVLPVVHQLKWRHESLTYLLPLPVPIFETDPLPIKHRTRNRLEVLNLNLAGSKVNQLDSTFN